MGKHLRGTLWRLAIYVTICALFVLAVFAVFGQFRFGQRENVYNAIFSTVSGLKNGDFVRIAGVEVGKVTDISINDDGTVRVEFAARDSVMLTKGTRANIQYQDLVGGRYLALEEGAGGVERLKPGDAIPIGAIAAVMMATSTHMILPLVCALVAGALVWQWFDRRALWPLRL